MTFFGQLYKAILVYWGEVMGTDINTIFIIVHKSSRTTGFDGNRRNVAAFVEVL